MNNKNVFDDIDALRRAGTKQQRSRKSKANGYVRSAKNGPYVQIAKDQAAAGFKALGCPAAMVWLEIVYLVWKTKSATVVLPNKKLEAMGVSRWAKVRALSRLEAAKLVRVVQIGKKAPWIKLLKR